MNGTARRCVFRRSRPSGIACLKMPEPPANRAERSSSPTTGRTGCDPRSAEGPATNRATGDLRRSPEPSRQPVRATPQAVDGRNSSVIDNLAKRMSSAWMSGPADGKPSSSAGLRCSARRTRADRERLRRALSDGPPAPDRLAAVYENNVPRESGPAVPEARAMRRMATAGRDGGDARKVGPGRRPSGRRPPGRRPPGRRPWSERDLAPRTTP